MNSGAVGTCEICGKKNVPVRWTVFRYNIRCECHSPCHHESVLHCNDCVPREPEITRIKIKTSELRNYAGVTVY